MYILKNINKPKGAKKMKTTYFKSEGTKKMISIYVDTSTLEKIKEEAANCSHSINGWIAKILKDHTESGKKLTKAKRKEKA
jgi:hypothetical protein